MNAKLRRASFVPSRNRYRIFGMHLHQESLELSRAIATRFVSTIPNVYMGILPLFRIYCAFVLKRATGIPISRRKYKRFSLSPSLPLVKLVREGTKSFKLLSRYLTNIVIRYRFIEYAIKQRHS